MSGSPQACMIVIGNEILSGRTQDANLHWLAGRLNALGIKLAEARVVPDIEAHIAEAVNDCRRRYDYVFTSGGIGPTHDDITTASVARAFDVAVMPHPEAEVILKHYYPPAEQTPERMKMALTPEGASLIPNPITAAPGFRMENVFVMAGVPSIFKAMFAAVIHELKDGAPILSQSISLFTPESTIATPLAALQNAYADIEIGSYPFAREGMIGTRIVLSGTDNSRIAECMLKLTERIQTLGFRYQTDDF